MAKRMQIDFVSDVVCPWCAVGLASLETALKRLDGEIEVEISFQPFELNPDMPPEGEDRDEHLMKKYGRTKEDFAAARETIRQRAAAVGFTMNGQDRIYNSFDAHRLLHWAALVDQAKQGEHQAALKHALLRAYFTDGLDISDRAVLVAKAAEAGLDPDEARAILASDRYAAEVKQEEQAWLATGINSVPAIVVNRTYLISGGQPPEVFETHLREMANRAD
ncbi:DsbA family oxidoreductase [Dongia sedimenti]|uniref:DsbA family oxidoreductase n=1 Tax=Dongia sedimenti TaxID=3064282 RepID=A0ABU0YNC1_9PROT|nr:DsbA family oxidoreductase [Rhodospirillaceae bacterium R-7]